MAFLKAIKPFFPFSYREKTGKDLALSIIIYVIINIVATVVLGVAAFLVGLLFADLGVLFWLLTAVLSLLGTVVGIYTVAGIAMSILHFTGVLDKATKTSATKKEVE